jgi:hypothetical protein
MRYLSLLVVFLLMSCSGKETVQSYFVEKSEESGFVVLDLPSKTLTNEKLALTEKQKQALHNFEKLNVLVYKPEVLDVAFLEKENSRIKAILKQSNLEELMRTNMGEINLKAYVDSNSEMFDEVVLYANMPEKGFGIIRFLGDNMKVNDALEMLQLLENPNLESTELKGLLNMFK